MRGPHAILFDLDMTLVETRLDIARSANEVRRQLGLPVLDDDVVAGFIGHGLDVLLERALGPAWVGREADAVARFRAHYREHCLDHSTVYDGVRPLIDALAGRRLGVVSNKPERFCRQILSAFDLDAPFEVIVGGDTTPYLKPGPEPVLEACRRLDTPAGDAVLVGDAVTDVASARAAGCRSIAVASGLSTRAELATTGPDAMADDMIGVWRILARWCELAGPEPDGSIQRGPRI